MDLKPGYKQTEVGVIPQDWEVKLLGDLGTIVRGGSPRPAGDPRYFNGDFIPWLTVAALTKIPEHQLNVRETVSCLTAEGAIRSRTLNEGTLIIANSGATLGVAKLLAIQCCANDGVAAIIRQHSGHKPFLCIYVNTQTKHLREAIATGNGQPNLNTALIRCIKVPFPQIAEQRKIASALSDVDGLLEALHQLIAKKRDLKQAAMQQLLTGQTRLPGFTCEWKQTRLGAIGVFLKGSGVKKDEAHSGDIPCVRYGEIYTHHEDCVRAYNSHISNEVALGAAPLRQGDLLFAGSGETKEEIGKCVAFIDDIEAYAGGDIVILRPTGTDPIFMGYYCNTPRVKRQKASKGQGDAVVHISAAALSAVELELPEIEEQYAIAKVLSSLDAELTALEQRRDKTRAIKQGMMQELLAGRTRLVEPQVSKSEEAVASPTTQGHNWAFNEAVVIATLVKHFGKEDFPLGRKRYTKLSYLLHRHAEREAEGYLKKAAGPYNPKTKYGGPEKIAQTNGYIKQHKGPKGHSGFVAADSIAQAEVYFDKWYGSAAVRWLEQFRFNKNDDLEVLATVDMAVQDLRSNGKVVDVAAVKDVIASHPEWKAKLDRACFADTNISAAINKSETLFGENFSGANHA